MTHSDPDAVSPPPPVHTPPTVDPAMRSEAVDWLARLEQAPHDAALRAEIEDWLAQDLAHRLAYDEAASLWNQAPAAEAAPAPTSSDGLAGGLPNGPVLWDRTQVRPTRCGIIVAAGFALIAAIAFAAFPTVQLWTMADHRTGAELREIALDDGSRITLDRRTAIAVSSTATPHMVDLLAGQAYFEIPLAPARPMVVTARGVTIAAPAPGASEAAFDVAASDDGVAVAVRSGAVSVGTTSLGAITDVTAGLQAKLPRGRAPVLEPISPDAVAAWRTQRLAFDGTTLREAVQEIARSLDTLVVFTDERIADQRVTSSVDLSRPDEALRTVVQLAGGQVAMFTSYLTVIASRGPLGTP